MVGKLAKKKLACPNVQGGLGGAWQPDNKGGLADRTVKTIKTVSTVKTVKTWDAEIA